MICMIGRRKRGGFQIEKKLDWTGGAELWFFRWSGIEPAPRDVRTELRWDGDTVRCSVRYTNRTGMPAAHRYRLPSPYRPRVPAAYRTLLYGPCRSAMFGPYRYGMLFHPRWAFASSEV